MQLTKQYIQQKIQPCIQQLFDHFLPQQNFKSIHDLFNAQKFHKFLMCILTPQTRLKIQDIQLLKQTESSNFTYNQMKVKNFKKIYEIIQNSFYYLGINMKKKLSPKQIQNMVNKFSLGILNCFLEYIFQLLKHNNDIVEFITTCPEDVQLNIMEIIKNGETGIQFIEDNEDFKGSQNSIRSLQVNSKIYHQIDSEAMLTHEQHVEQLQSSLINKQQQLKQLKLQHQQFEQELLQHRHLLTKRDQQIQILKKRILSYEQIDQLMQQKDDQILKLSQRIRQIQLKFRLKQSQLHNQNRSLVQKISILESKEGELQSKYEKQKHLLQILNKQKQQSDMSMKKVISNLKEKNKSLTDKINDLQKELIQINFQKEMKQKELNTLRNQANYGNSNNGGSKSHGNNYIVDNLSSPRSPLKNDEFLEGIQSFRGNYSKLGQQLSVDFDRAQFEQELAIMSKPGENNANKRFTQLLQQNYTLKQQVQSLHTSCTAQSKQGKQLHDQVQKLKKKITILKRRNDELDIQRKQQIDMIVGVMEQCYTSSVQSITNKK